RIWDVTRDQEAFNLPGQPADAVVALTPDGRRLVQQASRGFRVRDVRTGEDVLAVRTRHQVTSVTCSPDGRRVATATVGGTVVATATVGGTVTVWDAATGKEQIAVEGGCAAFSPDGRYLATGLGEPFGASEQPSEVKLWELSTGKEIR